jgi:hypothetical protein
VSQKTAHFDEREVGAQLSGVESMRGTSHNSHGNGCCEIKALATNSKHCYSPN